MAQQHATVLRSHEAFARYGRHHVRWMVQSGRWQRPAKGVVVLHSGSLTRDERLTSELLIQHRSAVLAGLTAASLDGLQGFATTTVFICVPHDVRIRPRIDVSVTRSRTLTDIDIHPVRRPRRTRLPRSLVDAASLATTSLRCQAILACGVQQGLVTGHSLGEVVARMPSLRRRALIVETIEDVSGGSLSEYEVLFLRLCRDYGFPTPTRQQRRRDAAGRWRYLDIEFEEFGLVVEIDGMQHMEALAWWEDMMRNNELVVHERKALLRFAGFALRHQRERVAEVLARFFATRTPRAA